MSEIVTKENLDTYTQGLKEVLSSMGKTIGSAGGSSHVVTLTANTTSACNITGNENAGKTETIIYTNSSGSSKTVTVPTTYLTPDGTAIVLTVPNGGYCEVNYLNINGTIYARGV